MSEEKVSHFSKPIDEITMEEIEKMSEQDLSEYIIEHPWSTKAGINDKEKDMMRNWGYDGLLSWSKELVTGELK